MQMLSASSLSPAAARGSPQRAEKMGSDIDMPGRVNRAKAISGHNGHHDVSVGPLIDVKGPFVDRQQR